MSERYLCPQCKTQFTNKERWFPFCSERCKLVDLGAWASEKYRIKGKEEEDQVSSGEDDGDGSGRS